MITRVSRGGVSRFFGLSSDTKPTASVGDQFVESDTGDEYEYAGPTGGWFIPSSASSVTGNIQVGGADVSNANPLPTDPGIVSTVGLSTVITPTITVNTAIYVAGDNIGGEITLSSALRAASSTGVLQNVLVIDDGNQKAPLTLLLMNDNPAGTYTDHAACPDLTSDRTKIVAKVNIAAADYETIGTIAVADITALSKVIKAGTSGGDLWLIVVTTGTPDYVASTDLTIRISMIQDY